MGYFDDSYYIASKLKQLTAENATDANGEPYNVYTLRAAIASAGMTPEDHYKAYGQGEKLSPNAYFNETEYLEAKLAQLESVGETAPGGQPYTLETLKAVIAGSGLSAAEHYELYGSKETTADGHLLNPSNAFDANAYVAAKLAQLQSEGSPEAAQWAGKTVAELVAVLQEAGISPVAHYLDYGAAEASSAKIPLVQTVPSEQRVANDPAREANHEVVPTNYNPATPAPGDAKPAPVTKPADVAQKVDASVSPAPIIPEKSAPVPGDDAYVAPPANIKDTVANPVIPPSSADAGTASGNWMVVNPDKGTGTIVGQDGTIKGEVKVEITPGTGTGGSTVVIPPAEDKPVDKLPPATTLPPSVTPDPDKPGNVTPPSTGGDGGSTGGTPAPAPTFEVTVTGDAPNKVVTFGGSATGDITITASDPDAEGAQTALNNVTFTRQGVAKTVDMTSVTDGTVEPPANTHFVTTKAVLDVIGTDLKASTTIIADAEANVKAVIGVPASMTKVAGFDVSGDNKISLTAAQAKIVTDATAKFAANDVITVTADTSADFTDAAVKSALNLGGGSILLDSTDNAISLKAATAQAMEAAHAKVSNDASTGDAITISDTGVEFAKVTDFTKLNTTALGGKSVALDVSDANNLDLTLAQVSNLETAGLKFTSADDVITIKDTGVNFAPADFSKLTTTALGAQTLKLDVSGEGPNPNDVTINLTQAGNLGDASSVKFAADDVITIKDTGAALAVATFANLATGKIGGTSVTLDASGNIVSLDVTKATAVKTASLKFAADDNLTITDIADDNAVSTGIGTWTTQLIGGNSVRFDVTSTAAVSIAKANLDAALSGKIFFNNITGDSGVDTVTVTGLGNGSTIALSNWAASDASGEYAIASAAADVAAGKVYFDDNAAVLTYWDAVADKAASITLTGVTGVEIASAGLVTVTA